MPRISVEFQLSTNRTILTKLPTYLLPAALAVAINYFSAKFYTSEQELPHFSTYHYIMFIVQYRDVSNCLLNNAYYKFLKCLTISVLAYLYKL